MKEENKRTFTIYGKCYEKLVEFERKHEESCAEKYKDSFGSLLSYTFVPSGIGDIVSVKCECGEELFLCEDFDF